MLKIMLTMVAFCVIALAILGCVILGFWMFEELLKSKNKIRNKLLEKRNK